MSPRKEYTYTLRNDYLFKKLLGVDINRPILKDFLICAFGFSQLALDDFELLDKELKKESINDKLGVLDIHIRLKDGTHINLEMQQLWTIEFVSRSIFYLAKIYTEDFTAGSSYSELHKCVSANIIAEGFNLNEKLHSVYVLKEKDIDERLGDFIEFHFFNLRKVRDLPIKYEDTQENKLINWLKFIDANNKEERDMLAKTSPVLQILNEKMNVLTLSKEERRIYDSRMKLKSDIVTISESSFKKGIAEGIEKGRAEGIEKGERAERLATARRMKAKECDVSFIAEMTGLSLEEVESI